MGKNKKFFSEINSNIYDMISSIIGKTGESKKAFLERVIAEEHKKLSEGQSIPGALHRNVEALSEMIKPISTGLPNVIEDTTILRNAANRLYSISMYLMKELYRTTSAMQVTFIHNNMINDNNKEAIAKESDRLAAKQFNIFMDQCKLASTGSIEILLRKE